MDPETRVLDLTESYAKIYENCHIFNEKCDFESDNYLFAQGLGIYLGTNFGLRDNLVNSGSLQETLARDASSLSNLISILCTHGPKVLIEEGENPHIVESTVNSILKETGISKNDELYTLFGNIIVGYRD